MNTKLISVTSSNIEDINSAEELIVYCGRVSNPRNQMNMETAPKLIKYLIKNAHWSPFEMASMCVEIKTSRAIATQILRHRSFSFQEFSQRYASSTEFEPVQIRKQAETNRQSSSEEFDPVVLISSGIGELDFDASFLIQDHLEESEMLYNNLISAGVARECARMVLPLTTETTLYMQGTIRSWIHYLNIRCDEHTQKEHRDIADSIKEIFIGQFPNISEALNWK